WLADPDRGIGQDQPGGWPFHVLPFVEQQGLYEVAGGGTGNARAQGLRTLVKTPIPFFHCPSRRPAQLYPHFGFYAATPAMTGATLAPPSEADCDNPGNW